MLLFPREVLGSSKEMLLFKREMLLGNAKRCWDEQERFLKDVLVCRRELIQCSM